VNLNAAIVKRKSLDLGKGLKSLSWKRQQHLSNGVDQPVAKFVDNGSGDSTIVQNKRLCIEPPQVFVSHTGSTAVVSEASGLVSTNSVPSNVLHAENESGSDAVITMVPSALLSTSHTVVANITGAVVTSSFSRPKVSETRSRQIQHLKFSSRPVTSVESVPSTRGSDHRQVAAITSQASHVQTNDTAASQQNTIADGIYLFWPNEDSLCWLDVAMALIVNCESLRGILMQLDKASCVSQLLTSFDIAQVNFRRSRKLYRCQYLCGQGKLVTLETSVGQVTVKTGGGHGPLTKSLLGRESAVITNIDLDDVSSIVSATDPHSTSLEKLLQEAKRLEDRAKQLMLQTRDDVFQSLQPRMYCKRGECNSALIALSELLSLEESVKSYFTVSYMYSLSCTWCGQPELGT